MTDCKTILCFGDSLTYGRDPVGKGRHPFESRWPNVLAAQLVNVRVIEAGLGSRTTNCEFPDKPGRNGSDFLPVMLNQNGPFDLVILLLGTNDAFAEPHRTPQDSVNGLRELIDQVRAAAARQVAALGQAYRQLAAKTGCWFADATAFCSPHPADGVHLDAENTEALGRGIAKALAASDFARLA